MKINRNIFREYDIRAIYEDDLKGDLPHYLGRSLGSYIIRSGNKRVCVGGDNRFTTVGIKSKLIEGLLQTGCDVTDIGILPTPVIYFARKHLNFDACVAVTASHNPPEFNGFKMVLGDHSIYGTEIQKIADSIESEDFVEGPGELSHRDVEDDYISFMRNKFSFKKGLRVGVDTGNGTAGPLIEKLFNILGISFVPLYLDSNPAFPNHPPDPVVYENMADLIETVKVSGLDAGFGFDGDGDRLGVIDDKGEMVWGDQLMVLYAWEILKKNPGAKIVFDVKCSRLLPEEIEKAGGVPIMWKTGHSLIENKMQSEGAPMAGELSGHLYFADEYYGYDDAIYASLRLLSIMEEGGVKLSDMVSNIVKYYSTPEMRIDVPDEKKFNVVEELKAYFRNKNEISDIDGVRVNFSDGWALVRASNTQPALVLRVEGETPGALKRIEKDFVARVKEYVSK